MKLICLLAVFLLVAAVDGKFVKVYNNIDDFRQRNPEATLIKLDFEDHELDASRSYSLGRRQTGKTNMLRQVSDVELITKIPGDSVVANANNKKSWPVSQNVTTTLSYPSSGTNGAFLTYVLINCEQASNLGRAYVTYGGVGQHFIQIVIEAKMTTYFNYAAFFYGIK